ncbi:MAG: 23S rRNA (uracil(1939)-C(5))-methyltransferase RlmD [Elusimicrobia bacterium]|nr:23S rRNA (uracil(1939)-C(5))-methyltransferase RlmD [Elusimicrobiota bacterium]
MPQVGTRLTVRMDRLALGGEGVGRWEGRVVFVPYACPGDVLEAEVTAAYPRYVRAQIVRILTPAPQRVSPPCPYHFCVGHQPTQVCGGCSWQHLTYEAQLEAKRQLVEETLLRIGRLSEVRVSPTLGMAHPWRYRNKVQQPVGWDGHRVISGFYAPGTHQIVPIEECLVQPELSVAILNKTKTLLAQYHLEPYDAPRHQGWVRHLLVRLIQRRALLVFVTRTPDFPNESPVVRALCRDFPELVGLHQNINPARTNVILGPRWRKLHGADFLEEHLGNLRLRVSPGSFFQVNTPQAETLYQVVKTWSTGEGEHFLICIVA